MVMLIGIFFSMNSVCYAANSLVRNPKAGKRVTKAGKRVISTPVCSYATPIPLSTSVQPALPSQSDSKEKTVAADVTSTWQPYAYP